MVLDWWECHSWVALICLAALWTSLAQFHRSQLAIGCGLIKAHLLITKHSSAWLNFLSQAFSSLKTCSQRLNLTAGVSTEKQIESSVILTSLTGCFWRTWSGTKLKIHFRVTQFARFTCLDQFWLHRCPKVIKVSFWLALKLMTWADICFLQPFPSSKMTLFLGARHILILKTDLLVERVN